MRIIPICILGSMLCSFLGDAQTAQHPVPPGLREAEKRRAPMEAPLPPQHLQVDLGQLKREADELTQLARTTPGQLNQVASGQLPKNVHQDRTRIEKLPKRLRTRVAP